MQVQTWKTSQVKPYEKNPRRNDGAVDAVAASIREFGFQQPLVVDKNGVLIVGHTRLKAAKKLGLKVVPVVVADTLTPEQVKAYRLADNKTGELAGWDEELLMQELAGLEMDMEQFGFLNEEIKENGTEKYTSNVNIPQYEVKGENPPISALFNDTKMQSLLAEIDSSEIPEEEKTFLRMAAYRHVVFDYTKIAEHYACATEDVQRLMEHSALVIIDVDDAIAGGYAVMAEVLDLLREEDSSAG